MNQLPGRKAAEPKTLEDDQEIVMSIRFTAHGSDNTAQELVERVVRQLSTMLHRDIHLIRFYVERPKGLTAEAEPQHWHDEPGDFDGKTEQARD